MTMEQNDRAAETKRRGRKRGHGEGGIYQLADGRWRGEIMVGRKADGKRDVRVLYGKTRGECQKKLGDLKRRRDLGLLADAGKDRDSLADYLDRWLVAIAGPVRASTVKRYTILVNLHIKPTLGKYKLSALKPDLIQGLYSIKLASGLSATTVQLIHTTLHKALSDAVEWGYLPFNPADRVRRPRRARFEAKPPTTQEVSTVLATADESGDRLLGLWTLLAHSGARLGELLGLKWTDMDLVAGKVSFQRGLVDVVQGVPVFDDQKTAASRRTIRIPEEAVSALVAHQDRQTFERQRLGDAYQEYGLVFATGLGTALGERNVMRSFKAALKRAGVREDVRLHDLRHAHATALAEAGTNLKVISSRLGHASIQITADLYTHTTQESDRLASEDYAKALKNARR
jgi:integrase